MAAAASVDRINPPVEKLQGIGRRRAYHLRRAGINRLFDVFFWFPEDIIDPAWLKPFDQALSQAEPSHGFAYAGRLLQIHECHQVHAGNKASWVEARIGDSPSAVLQIKWTDLNAEQLSWYLRYNDWLLVSGTLADGKLHNPLFVPLGRDYPFPLCPAKCRRYPRVLGMHHVELGRLIANCVTQYGNRLNAAIQHYALSIPLAGVPTEALGALHLGFVDVAALQAMHSIRDALLNNATQ